MSINIQVPTKDTKMLKPTITVFGVGGAGGNAVSNMIESNLSGVNFVVANTDAQALSRSLTEKRIQLGSGLTQGLGAGANPDIGRAAAEESSEEILGYLEGSHMVFITAGMGGGTGTGAAPVVARLAREKDILTVGVVTKPFLFEGQHRLRLADEGLKELQSYVDTLIVIPNQNLFRLANERTTFAEAFKMADNVLHAGVRGITDLIVMDGLVNLDFADVRAVMSEMGKAMMGTGEAEGDNRSIESAELAIANPLLDDTSMKGAKGVLINITGGYDMTLFEVDAAANRIREEVDPSANIIFGSTFDNDMEGKIRVSVVATGIEQEATLQNEQSNDSSENKPNSNSGANMYRDSFYNNMPRVKGADNNPTPKVGNINNRDDENNNIATPKINKSDSLATGKQNNNQETRDNESENDNNDSAVNNSANNPSSTRRSIFQKMTGAFAGGNNDYPNAHNYQENQDDEHDDEDSQQQNYHVSNNSQSKPIENHDIPAFLRRKG